jgi:hypothetical protein
MRYITDFDVEHIEIKTKAVNIIHFPYLDLSQNVKIRDVPHSLKSPRNSECKLAHIYGKNKGKVYALLRVLNRFS